MKKFLLIFSTLLISSTFIVKAAPDEGMWLPIFVKDLNINQMNEMGLKLTAEDIYSINNTSMKDAIVNFGNFCTAEVVSEQGLLFTNHHCGYGAIQQHSSIDHDYLTDGFWANSFAEELPCEGLTATFFIRMEDVTKQVLADVTTEMTEKERSDAIRKVSKELENAASEDGKYLAKVNGLFGGNEYYLFIYQVYKDVRMVGAPPSSIGKFGGDTDNWMWPRHTGDFSVFRIYADKDNQPAEYSEDNVPYTPKYVLPISVKGVEKDDFAMIWGYPGSTDRYLPSWGVKLNLEQTNPSIDAIFDIVLTNMKKGMDRSQDVNIMYASTHAGYANLWKNKKGETRGLKRLNVYDKKLAIENDMRKWINSNPENKAKYGETLTLLEEAYNEISASGFYKDAWIVQGSIMGSKIINNSYELSMAMNGIFEGKKKKDEINAGLAGIKDMIPELYFEYDQWTENLIFRELVRYLNSYFTGENALASLKPIDEKFNGNVDAFVDDVLKNSIYSSQENLEAFINKPNKKVVEKDPLKSFGEELIGVLMSRRMAIAEASPKLNKGNRLFIAAIREMNPDVAYYPNANFTMRLTYGSVLDYYPADAVHYDYICTLEGVMEKEDPTNDEFIVPAKLKELWKAQDYGDYADKNGKMVVCFLSDNDITGGNSGSPVINGYGEIIGIAFDGNWEAMSGDIAFEPELQRTISVDIRYVLFVIDKYAGCQRIIDELTIVK
ncbi:S46 family peptidase [Bacteroidales bacterium OttesenSCG-928-K03]|nr:S46 family peptidase [Bacteroidales bacterium OttesenSCG-928-L14]MDL2242309.1 S46 family peptidase [Bacteroidales bacterium OttesenSCG-928-K03]